ncbi:MAG: HAMP domain-containing histidine kinase [Deltaproteobacteria bacterium]|nr:HAMP domain-containing histidine kinase [Deltaproteobacteria bacterium]
MLPITTAEVAVLKVRRETATLHGEALGQLSAPSFCVFLRLFVRLRWLAVAATVGTIAFFQIVVKTTYNYPALYGVAAGIFAYNAFFFVLSRRGCAGKGVENQRASRANALVQINLDLVALFGLLHFAGGLENPCVMFFLFHVVIAGILLKPRWALVEAGVATFLIFALGLFERSGVLAHYHATAILGESELTDSWLFVLGLSSMLATTIFFLSTFTILLMRERHKQRALTLSLLADVSKKNTKLLRVDEGRRGLLAVASHDLKAPIATVAGYLMTLKGGYLGEVSDKQISILEKCLGRLDGLKDFVSDVLSWTAIESGEMQMAMRSTDVKDLLGEVVERYGDPAANKEIDLVLKVDNGLPEVILAVERMRQVFANLLSNAAKYTPEGGCVEIHVKRGEGGGVEVAVKDTGIGMSPEDQEHLFEGFFRSSAVRGRFEGTGLGLSLAKGIVEAHHGRLWATSELGEGSTFYVELPLGAPGGV